MYSNIFSRECHTNILFLRKITANTRINVTEYILIIGVIFSQVKTSLPVNPADDVYRLGNKKPWISTNTWHAVH